MSFRLLLAILLFVVKELDALLLQPESPSKSMGRIEEDLTDNIFEFLVNFKQAVLV